MESVYKRLREHECLKVNMMTLRPMEYLPLGSSEPYVFKIEGSRTNFLKCLDSMLEDSFEERRENFLYVIMWELVDGQYILHACQVLANHELGVMKVSSSGFLRDDQLRYWFMMKNFNIWLPHSRRMMLILIDCFTTPLGRH